MKLNKIADCIFSLILCMFIVCFPLNTLAEKHALTHQEAIALMDAMENIYCSEDADIRSIQHENEAHTREWEKKYGNHVRWNGDITADYVLEYGMMPTHDTPYANPLAVYPDHAVLAIDEAKAIGKKAVSSVETRLTAEKLDQLTCLWEFCYSRDLGWWWTYDGTWAISWFDGNTLICRAYLRDADGKPAIVFVHLDNDDPYSDDGVITYSGF